MRSARILILSALLLLPALGTSHAQDEQARQHWLHELGGPFFVSRNKVQDDLNLSDDQKLRLRTRLTADIQEVEAVQNLKPDEREPAMRSLREKSYPKIENFLQEILTADQLKRFQQLKLQYDIPSIMLQPGIGKELGITDEQKKQFMALIQEMQKAIMPLLKEAKAGGHPEEILPKVIKLRQDCQEKIEGLLSDAQRVRWKEMTGRPLVIW